MSDRQGPLPYALRQALIQACGKVFYYKGGLVELFASAGVPAASTQRYVSEDLVKFQIARRVLEDLDQRGLKGHVIQQQIVDALLQLDGPADDAADPREAKAALAELRRAAGKRVPKTSEGVQKAAAEARRRKSELQQRAQERQAERIRDLQARFYRLSQNPDKQARGYEFEPFLRDLFQAFDIEYRASYRTGSEQIDGAFKHAGRDFLVEARWRKLSPSLNDLLHFAFKVQGKLAGTLGLVITMVPPAPEVLLQVAQQSRSILIMDGADLALILEGQATLTEGLEFKRRSAAQEGNLFASLTRSRVA